MCRFASCIVLRVSPRLVQWSGYLPRASRSSVSVSLSVLCMDSIHSQDDFSFSTVSDGVYVSIAEIPIHACVRALLSLLFILYILFSFKGGVGETFLLLCVSSGNTNDFVLLFVFP